jgi:predicted nucleotidyltransferase
MPIALSESIRRAAAILREQGASEVYVFGSAADGRMHDGSDIDLAVVGMPPERYYRAFDLAASVLERPMHLVDLDEDTPFTRHLKSEGELERVE